MASLSLFQSYRLSDRPYVYLDQWALSTFSAPGSLRERLLKILGRGTLMVSLLNLMETARTRGATTLNIVDFYDGVGSRWVPILGSPRAVRRRESEGLLDPWRDDAKIAHLLRAPRVDGKLGNLISRLQEPWAAQMLEAWEREAADIASILTAMRNRSREGTLQLDRFSKVPVGRLDTRSVFTTVTQRLAGSSLNLDRHQVDDLLHACVAMAHADVVFLDHKTKLLFEGMDTKARAYYRGELEYALTYLDTEWPGAPRTEQQVLALG